MTPLKTISPQKAAELVRQGAVLVDIREVGEHAREHIPGAAHHALSQIEADNPIRRGDDVLIFHCRSGARTRMHAARLKAAAGPCEVFVLEGGIEAWRRAGLPTSRKAEEGKRGQWWPFTIFGRSRPGA